MNGEEALRGYGYTLRKGMFSLPGKPTSQHWQVVEGGWLRFDGPEKSPIPYGIKDAFQGIAGIDISKPDHAPCFEWAWPDEEVARIYVAAIAERERYLAERAARRANWDAPSREAAEQADLAGSESDNVIEQIDAIAATLNEPEPEAIPERKRWWQR